MKIKSMTDSNIQEKKRTVCILDVGSVLKVNNVHLITIFIKHIEFLHAEKVKNVSFYIKIDANFSIKE